MTVQHDEHVINQIKLNHARFDVYYESIAWWLEPPKRRNNQSHTILLEIPEIPQTGHFWGLGLNSTRYRGILAGLVRQQTSDRVTELICLSGHNSSRLPSVTHQYF